jgi:P-type Ca2+ transporter type 2C
VHAARAAGISALDAQGNLPRVAEIPFEAQRKCMTTVHRDADGSYLSITKGAPEVLTDQSCRVLGSDGPEPIDRDEVNRLARSMAADGLRVIAVAERRLHALPDRLTPDALECWDWSGSWIRRARKCAKRSNNAAWPASCR